MNYLISIDKILKIVHPFNDSESIFYQQEAEVSQLLKNLDIFPSENDSQKEKQLKALAYEVANYERKEIQLYIPLTGEVDSIEEFIPSGFTHLAAATLLGIDSIVASVEGDPKLIYKLLKVELNKPANIEISKADSSKKFNIVWEVTPDMLTDTWGDPQFVIDYLYPCAVDQFKTKIQEVFRLALPELWDDSNFIKEILKVEPQFFYQLTSVYTDEAKNLKFKDSVYELVKEDPKYFNLVWGASYDYKEQLFREIENLEVPIDNYYENENFSTIGQQRRKIASQIKNELYTNVDYIIEVLTTRKMWHDEVYNQLPDDVKFHSKLLDAIYLNDEKVSIYPHYRLTEKYLNDIEWLENFVIKYCDKLEPGRVNDYREKSFNNNHLKEIYSPWIGSKKKVLDLISKVQGQQFHHFYKVLPTKLRVDEDVVKAFMDYSHDSFALMEREIREPYISQYINGVSEGKLSSHAISKEEIFNIKDKNLLIKIIEKGHINWLTDKNCPREWKTDIELLNKVKTPSLLISSFQPDKDILNTLSQNKSAILSILRKENSVYYHLPESLQNDEEILLGMLSAKLTIPKHYYAEKEFCLKSAMVNSESCKNIPHQFWQEEVFVKTFFKLVDENKISNLAIKNLPAEINQVLSAFNIKKDYSKFMDNFILNQKLHSTPNTNNKVKQKNKL